MTFDDAREVLVLIESTSLEKYRINLVASAVRYARLRTDWAVSPPEARLDMDNTRTAAHEAFIDDCNILSRNMRTHGEDNSWRTRLGDDRKVIGDFACYLHALLGIRAR